MPGTIWPTAGGDIPAQLQDPTGRVFLNPELQQYEHDWLFASGQSAAGASQIGGVVAALAGQDMAFTPQLIKGDQGDFEGAMLCATSTGRFSARIYDSFLDRWLSNAPVANELMFGNGDYPGWLAQSTFIPGSVSQQVSVVDLSNASNTIVLQMAGRRMMSCMPRMAAFDAYRSRRSHPYWLTFDLGAQQAVAASTTTQFIMTVPAGVQFLAKYLMDDTSRNSDGTVAEYNVRIFNGNNGESLIGAFAQGAVPISLVASKSRAVTGVQGNRLRAVGNPFKLPYNHLFSEKTQVTVEVTNPNAFQIDVRLAWHGIAIYADRCPPGVNPMRLLEQPVGYAPMPESPRCGPLQCDAVGVGPSVLTPMPAPSPATRQQSPYAVPPPQAPPGYQFPGWAPPPSSIVNQQQAAQHGGGWWGPGRV